MDQIAKEGHGIGEHSELTFNEKMQEVLLCGLRKISGISQETFKKQSFGKRIEEMIDIKALERLQKEGLIIFDQNDLKLTTKGMALQDGVLVDLFFSLKS